MYLADYDPQGYPLPYGYDTGCKAVMTAAGICNVASPWDRANPYLREPVILDDYVKNRDIWKCPSAKVMNGAPVIVPDGSGWSVVQQLRGHAFRFRLGQ